MNLLAQALDSRFDAMAPEAMSIAAAAWLCRVDAAA